MNNEYKPILICNGSTCLETNSPAVLELFQTKLFDFTDKKKDEND